MSGYSRIDRWKEGDILVLFYSANNITTYFCSLLADVLYMLLWSWDFYIPLIVIIYDFEENPICQTYLKITLRFLLRRHIIPISMANENYITGNYRLSMVHLEKNGVTAVFTDPLSLPNLIISVSLVVIISINVTYKWCYQNASLINTRKTLSLIVLPAKLIEKSSVCYIPIYAFKLSLNLYGCAVVNNCPESQSCDNLEIWTGSEPFQSYGRNMDSRQHIGH